jgi:hypothetical protein
MQAKRRPAPKGGRGEAPHRPKAERARNRRSQQNEQRRPRRRERPHEPQTHTARAGPPGAGGRDRATGQTTASDTGPGGGGEEGRTTSEGGNGGNTGHPTGARGTNTPANAAGRKDPAAAAKNEEPARRKGHYGEDPDRSTGAGTAGADAAAATRTRRRGEDRKPAGERSELPRPPEPATDHRRGDSANTACGGTGGVSRPRAAARPEPQPRRTLSLMDGMRAGGPHSSEHGCERGPDARARRHGCRRTLAWMPLAYSNCS